MPAAIVTRPSPAIAPTRDAPPREPRPGALNGDVYLNPRQVRLYMDHHAARNARHAALSRREGIRTLPAPPAPAPHEASITPARAALNSFFAYAAASLARRFAGREVTILDIGAGSGPCLSAFESAGYRGTYIGLDLKRHPRWSDGPTPVFRKRLILGDCLALDPASLPPLDLIISSTALEHIADDAAAIARLSTRLTPGGAQVHYVPGEAALPLYGPHGWRQYSPRCLRALFPRATIYRAGGPISSALHRLAVTTPPHGWSAGPEPTAWLAT
jgi:SAM-dependent methyltransferase